MHSKSFDSILENVDLMLSMYKVLELGDQLRLAQVNAELKELFHKCIWRENYSTLVIHMLRQDFVVTNETHGNRLKLSASDLVEFLRIYGEQLQVLTQMHGTILDTVPFGKLTSLSYWRMTLPKNHLETVARNCTHLQNLHLYCCTNPNFELVDIGRHCSTSTLCDMKNLKRLSLENDKDYCLPNYIDYEDFRQILENLPLEYLLLTAVIMPTKKCLKAHFNVPLHLKELVIKVIMPTKKCLKAHFNVPLHLKELVIEVNFEPKRWCKNYANFLSIFKKLIKLTLKADGIITSKILKIFSENFNNLETLNLLNPTFDNIKTFCLPAKLLELSLIRYDGLRRSNLKQILTRFKIKKFCSSEIFVTEFDEEFQDLRISPFLESLNFNHVQTYRLKSAYENNVNLKELMWYDYSSKWYEHKRPVNVHLGKCINLEILNIVGGYVPPDALLQLKFLHKLTLSPNMCNLDWSYIMAVLKHPSLRELCLNDPNNPSYSQPTSTTISLKTATDIPVEGFPIKLSLIKISQDIFEMAFEFWLDLFVQNNAMKLFINYFNQDEKFLKKLINHANFPKCLKTIDVCCFTLKCSDLRRCFEETMRRLTHIMHDDFDEDEYRCRQVMKGDVFRIILSRQ